MADPQHDGQAAFHLDGLYCPECARAVEQRLRAQPHITRVHLDWPHNQVHVGYHAALISPAEIAQIIAGTGCKCALAAPDPAQPAADHGAAPDPQRALQHLRHGVDVQPITMGTKYDRMQYELPVTAAHAGHQPRPEARSDPHAGHTVVVAPADVAHPDPVANHAAHTETSPDHSGHPARIEHSPPESAAGPAMDHVTHTSADTAPGHAGHAAPAVDHTGMDHTGHSEAMDHAAMGHGGMDHDMSDPGMAAAMEIDMRNKFFIALLLTIPIVLYSPVGMSLTGLQLPTFGLDVNWILLVLTTPIVFYCGWIFIAGAYYSLRLRTLNMSVLIATGVLAAYLASVLLTFLTAETFFEAAAMLVTFVLFGHWMEMRARKGTNDALRALFDLVPPQATVIRDGVEQTIPSSEVRVGDTVLLRPGDKVPVDGVVTQGSTTIDESLVTGESVPVAKRPGDPVVAGAINRTGSVRFEATKVGADTVLAQIVELVRQAQNSKAPGQRLADRAAQYLVIVAVGAGVLTFLAWYGIAGAGFLTALTFAISAVVIACPDALGLATPTAVAVGTGVGARHNILIKDAATLEGVSAVTAVVLDKTGTLTEGRPRVTDIVPAGGWSAEDLLRLVAAAEHGSEHPLADAIITGARDRHLELAEAHQFQAIAGHGIEAQVEGHAILVGNRKLMTDRGIAVDALDEQAATLAQAGRTPMFAAIDGRAAGLIAVADPIKPTAREAVRQLQERGIAVVMITGDNRHTADAVAAQLGIARVFAEVLPAQKAGYVKQLQAEGKRVAMVGDGVNDAPALAQADIGIAIGAGTDVAIATAKVVLMKSDPLDVVRAITLSQATVRKMKQNLVWASIYNLLAIPVAAGVFYPAFGIMLRPEWSALLMAMSSIIVAVNAVSLKRVEGDLARPAGVPVGPAPQPAGGATGARGRAAPRWAMGATGMRRSWFDLQGYVALSQSHAWCRTGSAPSPVVVYCGGSPL
ncbi:MAG TPA: heavy metal translocating P-type ATPase [Chloroflexia bacterium]